VNNTSQVQLNSTHQIKSTRPGGYDASKASKTYKHNDKLTANFCYEMEIEKGGAW